MHRIRHLAGMATGLHLGRYYGILLEQGFRLCIGLLLLLLL